MELFSTTDNLFADSRRQQLQREAWSGYIGNLPDSLTRKPGDPDTNVKSNRLAPIVDTGTFYLFGLPLTVEVDAESCQRLHVNPEQAQKALDGCWGDEDDMMTVLAKLSQNGGVFGTPYAKTLTPQDTSTPYCRVVILDPQTVSVQTDPDDCERAICYTIAYEARMPGGVTLQRRQIIARRDVWEMRAALERASQQTGAQTDQQHGSGSEPTDGDDDTASADDAVEAVDLDDPLGDAQWVIASEARSGEGGDWVPTGDPIAWPHPWPPIADCQNLPLANQHGGLADLTPDLIQLNTVLNFILSNINAVGLNHGHPWVWAAGTDLSGIGTAPGNIITIPSPDGKLEALVAKGDIAGLMAFAEDIRSSMDEQSKVPGVATGRLRELPRALSGVALRMLYQPLLFKTTFKRRTYGKLIRELSTRMLALCGFGDGTDLGGVKVTLHWQDPLPSDDLSEAQTALAWSQLGVSHATLMSRGGFNPDDEAQKKAKEDAAQLTAWTQGQGMPPANGQNDPNAPPPAAPGQPPQPSGQNDPNAPPQPGQPGQPGATGNGGNTPPTNHPAAVAARQKMRAAFAK